MLAIDSQTLALLAAGCITDALMNALKCPVLAVAPQWLESMVMSLQNIQECAQYPLKECDVVSNPLTPKRSQQVFCENNVFFFAGCKVWNAVGK